MRSATAPTSNSASKKLGNPMYSSPLLSSSQSSLGSYCSSAGGPQRSRRSWGQLRRVSMELIKVKSIIKSK